MALDLYYRLSTNSRRAMLKTSRRWGHPYFYRPRGNLLERLSKETGLEKHEVLEKLLEERRELLRAFQEFTNQA